MLSVNVGVNGFFVLKDFATFRAHVLSCFCFRGDFALSHLTHQFISFNNKRDKDDINCCVRISSYALTHLPLFPSGKFLPYWILVGLVYLDWNLENGNLAVSAYLMV